VKPCRRPGCGSGILCLVDGVMLAELLAEGLYEVVPLDYAVVANRGLVMIKRRDGSGRDEAAGVGDIVDQPGDPIMHVVSAIPLSTWCRTSWSKTPRTCGRAPFRRHRGWPSEGGRSVSGMGANLWPGPSSSFARSFSGSRSSPTVTLLLGQICQQSPGTAQRQRAMPATRKLSGPGT
jgi:hypothetical protein